MNHKWILGTMFLGALLATLGYPFGLVLMMIAYGEKLINVIEDKTAMVAVEVSK